MAQGAFEYVGQDLHVAMRVQAKARSRLDSIVIEHP